MAAFGIDHLLAAGRAAEIANRRFGLLSNARCLTAAGKPTTAALIDRFGMSTEPGQGGLARLFSPEHGWAGQVAAGEPSGDGKDPATGLPVHSLYGPRLAPEAAILADLDAVIIDLMDVGVRCYTFAATAAIFAKSAMAAGLDVIICDRPNPLGPTQAGPLPTDTGHLLAYFDVPFVHGQRLSGLLAPVLSAAQPTGLKAVEPARVTYYHSSAASAPEWVAPSPALAHPQAVNLYPGLVLLEGTNVSEGRGTSKSFQVALAPWLDGATLIAGIKRGAGFENLPIDLEPWSAKPNASKFAGEICCGVEFLTNGNGPDQSLALGVYLLCTLRAYQQFSWLPAAQDGSDRFFIDRLVGTPSLREQIDAGATPVDILSNW